MDVVKFLMESKRMCQRYKVCSRCPLNGNCIASIVDPADAVRAVAIVEKWSNEHPIETNGMRFLNEHRDHIRTYHRWENGCKPYIEVHIEADWWDAEYKEGDE